MNSYEYVYVSEPDGRKEWPYSKMAVGQTVRFFENQKKAQQYAHTYARQSGFKFRTWKQDGFMYVKRVA